MSGITWLAIGLVVALVAAAVAVGGLGVLHRNSGVSAQSCQETVPSGASPAATAFLNALNTSYVGWTSISRSIASEHDVVHLYDLENEASTDQAFVNTVQQIQFPPAARATARQYLLVITDYIQLLHTAIDHYGIYSTDHDQFLQLDNARSNLAFQLRTELALPAARCTLLRP